MNELELVGVRVQVPDNQPVVLLRELHGHRYLPVWVGSAEASAIALAHQGVQPPRPMTHDLIVTILGTFNHTVDHVEITAMVDNVFHADLVFANDTRISCRTSDALAIATRISCSIYADPAVLTAGSVAAPADETGDDDEVAKFREFLDHVSAEDFSIPDVDE